MDQRRERGWWKGGCDQRCGRLRWPGRGLRTKREVERWVDSTVGVVVVVGAGQEYRLEGCEWMCGLVAVLALGCVDNGARSAHGWVGRGRSRVMWLVG